MAMLATHMGASAGALAWMIAEWTRYGKPSMLGVATGMVAGLGTITPASGFVGPMGAVAIGLAAGHGLLLRHAVPQAQTRDRRFAGRVAGHGVGGVLGTLLTGVFGAVALGGTGFPVQKSMAAQVGIQALGVVATASWCAVVTWVILKVINAVRVARRRRAGDRRPGSRRAWRARVLSLTCPSKESQMPRAIRIHEVGGPEVMRLEEVEVAAPAAGEVQVQHTAIGVNFIDVYDRTGHYPQNHAGRPGSRSRRHRRRRRQESARLSCGRTRGVRDRRARLLLRSAQCPRIALVKIPAGVSDEQAAVLMLKGMTACYLLRHTLSREARRLHRGARGGGWCGILLSQWGTALGAMVIGIVGSEDKATLAKKNGCKHVLVRGRDDIAAAVQQTLEGSGRPRGLRRRRQGHLHRVPGLPAQARADGELWQRFRSGAAVLRRRPRETRLAVRHAPHAVRLHRRASRTWNPGPRNVRGAEEEVAEAPGQPALQAGRRRAGASRPGARKTTGASVILPA